MGATDGSHRVLTIPADAAGQRLDKYLSGVADLELTRSRVQNLIAADLVFVDGRLVSKNYKIRGGEAVDITIPMPEVPDISPENIPLDVVYDDQYLAIVNKPAGLVTHPAPGNPSHTLVNALMYHFRLAPDKDDDIRPGIVHRLDKNTSGLLIVSKDAKTGAALRKMIADREIKKKYIAVICGSMPDDEGTISLPIGRSKKDRKKMTVTHIKSREAITKYQVDETYWLAQKLDITLVTGRTHQIRVHLAHLNHPVLGDPDYGGRQRWIRGIEPSLRAGAKILLENIDRQALHACEVEFEHPTTGNRIIANCPMPDDIAQLVNTLRVEYPMS